MLRCCYFFFQPQRKSIKTASDRFWKKKKPSCISRRKLRGLFTSPCRDLIMSIWYSFVCVGASKLLFFYGNGDFQWKIPGVEANVVRIQIDILFPLFSSLLLFSCREQQNPLSKSGKRYSSQGDDTKRARSKFFFFLLLLTRWKS